MLKPQGKLNKAQARVLCRLAVRGRVTQRRVAAWFGVSQPVVSQVRQGKLWESATEDIRGVPPTEDTTETAVEQLRQWALLSEDERRSCGYRWLPVRRHEGVYEVSSRGEIRRVARGRGAQPGALVAGVALRSGHLQVNLEGDRTYVHRVVLEAFAGPCPPGQECRHLSGDPADNRWPENLAWGTRIENAMDRSRHGTGARKLSREQARAVCRLALRGRMSHRRVASWFGVSNVLVSHIRRGAVWGWATEDIRAGG